MGGIIVIAAENASRPTADGLPSPGSLLDEGNDNAVCGSGGNDQGAHSLAVGNLVPFEQAPRCCQVGD
jgi:hypothetical protein